MPKTTQLIMNEISKLMNKLDFENTGAHDVTMDGENGVGFEYTEYNTHEKIIIAIKR